MLSNIKAHCYRFATGMSQITFLFCRVPQA